MPFPPTHRRYLGFLATPALWADPAVFPYRQIDLPGLAVGADASATFRQQRLGKLVEEFVFHQLQRSPAVNWIADGVQIQEGKRTVGEIDALYQVEEAAVHLEVAYKFYLYDTIGQYPDSLARWIGPNRKDNLALKLEKLRKKQFPLLHNPLTGAYLAAAGLKAADIEQRLCFKAQLFLPYADRQLSVSPLERACVAGFYLPFDELPELRAAHFFIPPKLDWLVSPHPEVDWLAYPAAETELRAQISGGRSPMIWCRYPDGRLEKGFVVFW